MEKKTVSAIMLTLLLMGMLTLAFNLQPVKASGTIYIRANGLVEGTNKITTADNVTYMFTDNISDSIVVERSNIIVDGNGYTLQGSGSGNGFYWYGINNVTVKNTKIKDFDYGVYPYLSNNSTVSGNTITNSKSCVLLWESDNIAVFGNTITNSTDCGVDLFGSNGNVVSGNTITNSTDCGVDLRGSNNSIVSGNTITNSTIYCVTLYVGSSNNKIYHNNFINNSYQAYVSSDSLNNVWDDGYPSGGNYWSDYNGTDFYSGHYQNMTRSDGIGDTPYLIDVSNQDDYPLMKPWSPVLNSTRYPWSMFHHDLKHTGYSESPAPNTNNTLWNYTTGNYVVSSPAVVNGKVYVGSWDGNVYCLDALAGACIWNYTTGGMVGSSPAVVNERLYIGSYDFRVYCLDASTGAQIWNYTTSDSRISSPAVVDGRVYVGSGNTVYALNASTGAHIWDYTTSAIVRSSPAVVDGRVYVGSGDFKLYALDAVTGLHIWNYTTGNSVNSSPSVVDGKVYVGSDDCNVYCLNAATGERIWNYTTGSSVSGSPAVAYGKVYVGSYDHRVYALDALTGTHIWNYTTEDEMYGTVGTPAVADDKLYIGSGDGWVYTLNASTGAKIWKYKTGGPVSSSPAVADGIVYFGSTYDHKVWAIGNVIKSENYPTIQEAIDASAPGTTIWIAPDIYNESLVINKTITLIGKPGSEPIFNGGGSGIAITLLPGASGSVIAGIVITHWDQGILIIDATNVKIYDNIMSLINCNGITLEGSNAADNLIYSNIFQENTVAINLTASATSNTIYKNIITLNNISLNLESSGNNITANIIAENQVGIDLSNSNNNIIYHNNFISNDIQASISASTGNTWDNGCPSGGNYWSSYASVDLCHGPSQNETGSDGINDTQYTIAINNVDRYPLVHPFSPHDVGIPNVITAKTVVGQGYTSSIDLKILNYGMYDENFIVVAYANAFVITAQAVTLTKRNSIIITFKWNTTGFAYGNYTIKVVANQVPDETDTADNTFIGGWVYVGIPGDVNADGIVEMMDFYYTSLAFGSEPRNPNWNPNTDVNDDHIVEMMDFFIISQHFGQHYP